MSSGRGQASGGDKSTDGTVTRSKVYASEGLIFKVGSKLFRFPTIWHLAQASEFFEAVQQLRANVPTGGEGSSDEKPIIIHDREDDFESFALWLFQMKHPLLLSEWIGVLALSTKYCMKMGVEQAIERLGNPSNKRSFQPCYKLRLAWEFEIKQWYEDCLMEILSFPPNPLSKEDVRDLEPELVAIFMSVRESVQRYRLSMLTTIPDVRHGRACDADNRGRCTKEYINAYLAAVMNFAHTADYQSGRDVFGILKKLDVPGVHADCKKANLIYLRDNNILWKEEELCQLGCTRMKRVLESTRPQLPRPEPRYES